MTDSSPTRFLRAHDDRVLGGVAGGLGKAFGVDAIIFRIAFAALVFAGGVGIVAYAAALILVPADDGTGHPAPREGTWRTAATVGGGILLVFAALVIAIDGGFWAGGWLVWVAVVAAIGYGALRLRDSGGPQGSTGRRLLIACLVGTAVLVGAGAAFWGSAWATAAGAGVAVAAVVLALGAALLVAAYRGDRRARWLAVPAIIIAFPAAVVSAADISLDGGVGERSYRPTGADQLPGGYRLGAGQLVVDLRELDWSGGRREELDLDLGVGHAVVLVPEEVCVGAVTDVRAGYANVLGRDAGGVDVVHDVRRTAAPGAPALTLDADLGMGAVEVLHRWSESDVDDAADRRDEYEDDRLEDRFEEQEERERLAAGRLNDRACAGGPA